VRWVRFTIGVAAAAGAVFFCWGGYQALEIRRLSSQVNQLERDRERLVEYARRLSASRRVAQADVIEQFTDQRGRVVSAIVWHEMEADGVLSAPQSIEVVGDLVYFEAAVIKFAHQLVGDGDARRGESLAVFRRVFGEHQPAASAAELNRSLTARLQGADRDGAFDVHLWALFWDMMDDPALAEQYGVRVAQCEAPAVRVKAGQVWEISLDAAGGLNLRLIRERRDVTYQHDLRGSPSA